MECVVPLGRTNKATLGIKLPSATACTGLAGELWLSVHFNEHTMATFLFKCVEEPAYGSPPTPPLYTESRILVRPEKKCLKFQQHQLASYNSYKILAI